MRFPPELAALIERAMRPKRDAWVSVNGVTRCVNCDYIIQPGDLACPDCFPGSNHHRSKFWRDPFKADA